MKVYDSKEVNKEEFLDWYFQIKEKIFICITLEIDKPTPFQEAIDSPNQKKGDRCHKG